MRLIQAAEAAVVDGVITCLCVDADLFAQDRFGETALHYAAENGHFEVLNYSSRLALISIAETIRREHHSIVQRCAKDAVLPRSYNS
ncbi:hypothetical protein ASPWEDRAFT_45705 [Aspergillus wentii DTO 134E9]|uniref:Uncharacterized protein n=1 Tax=Aspergillus wentii DTO 134E9 TaxID=1073089 RepID=A0A1L9R5D7_ASPWE|nr:uncharacterized protein ASPWEDRAFT_45705 [Aspergillus wentii DTO 134E9]OJJ30131.1 hypothetical protein ASPWEDRAFT_45705 [Aspergillus wentii DTO 134E9]